MARTSGVGYIALFGIAIEDVYRMRPKLAIGVSLLASLVPIPLATNVDSDVMKPIAAPIVAA